ncbi:MAG: hypothetical protein ACM34M_16300, partial [Ignavibacteria bacterium]
MLTKNPYLHFTKYRYLIVLTAFLSAGIVLFHSCTSNDEGQQTAGKLDRTVLPIKEPTPPTYTELDARDATAPPRFEVKA